MGPHKYKINYGNVEIFKFYKDRYKNPAKLTKGKYFEIFKEYITYLREIMIYNSFTFHIPGKLGSLYFYKYKVKIKLTEDGKLDKRNLRVDWINTKQLWSELYPNKTASELKLIENKPRLFHLNKHSDGYRIRCHWDKSTAVFRHKHIYKLKLLRVFSRELAKGMLTNPNIDFGTYDPSIFYKNKTIQECIMESL